MTMGQIADAYCSALSLEAGEPLIGSAPHNQVWLLLEYTRPWGTKVLPESDLSDAVKGRLSGLLKAIPKSNLLFIKREIRGAAGIRFYVALARERDPLLYEFHLGGYDDLVDLNIEGAAAGQGDAAHLTRDELFLVCTNAKRDRCCAKFGLPLYRALSDYASSSVWQCSHIGGHRFAPTSLFFPHGINYGRIDSGKTSFLIDEYRRGRIVLDHLRGRVCYDSAAQAADYFLRRELELNDLDALRLHDSHETEQDRWIVRFNEPEQNLIHSVQVVKDALGKDAITSCAAAEQTALTGYRLGGHERRPVRR